MLAATRLDCMRKFVKKYEGIKNGTYRNIFTDKPKEKAEWLENLAEYYARCKRVLANEEDL